jgi:hypothetical protein
MRVKNWIVCVQDRGKWKEAVEKAKIFVIKVRSAPEDEKEENLLNSLLNEAL